MSAARAEAMSNRKQRWGNDSVRDSKRKKSVFLRGTFSSAVSGCPIVYTPTPLLANYLTKQRSTTEPRRPLILRDIKKPTW